MKVFCYGVRDVERPIFEKLNKTYGYELTLVPEYLKSIEDAQPVQGHEAVIVRGNCFVTREVLELWKSFGVRYVLTRTVGVNHVDIATCKELGMRTGYVPFYSPNAIAELAVTLSMMLLRHTAGTVDRSSRRDFRVLPEMFSREIRLSTVGVIGTGRIGFTAAKLFCGLGARVLGYDCYPRNDTEGYYKNVSLDQLLAESDVISVHIPFIKEQGRILTKEFVSKMKPGAILVNTARGELQDLECLLDAVESGKLGGLGLDTLEGEGNVFFQSFDHKLSDPVIDRAVSLYPRVLITPHIGSYTDEAAKNMIETSFENLNQWETEQRCDHEIA